MQTRKIGQILADERQKQRITLTQLSQVTKIKIEYLQALEKNQFDQLPASVFIKGFIKSYARVLKLDQRSLLAILRRDYQENKTGELLLRQYIRPVSQRQKQWKPITLVVVVVAAIFLSLAGYIGFQWYNLNKPPSLEIYSPEENEFVSSQIVVSGAVENEVMVSVNAQPVSTQPDGTFKTEVYLPREGISTITIEAVDQKGRATLQQRTVYVKF